MANSNHQSQIVRVFEKYLDTDTAGSLGKVFVRLTELGWTVKPQFNPYSSLYTRLWNHPAVDGQDDKKGAAVMSYYWLHLYRKSDDVECEVPEYVFVAGRMGNTRDFLIDPPKTYSEDREIVERQATLF